MRTKSLRVAEGSQDLLMLPVGTSILTKQNRIYELDEIEAGRKDSGSKYWIEPGALQPFPVEGLDHWFPALILPENM